MDIFKCSKCNRDRDNYDICGVCKAGRYCCCECFNCWACYNKRLIKDHCDKCKACKICCQCPPLKFFKNKLKFHKSKDDEFKVNKHSRFISTEIEVASIGSDNGISKIIQQWSGSIVKDGSLPKSGFEINTAPANGDLFIDQITDICIALNNSNATINPTCGLHIHLDARDFSYYDIRNLIKIYSVIEPALFMMVPESRRTSKYCKPCGNKYLDVINKNTFDDLKLKLIDDIYDEPSSEGRFDKYGSDSRYDAMNLHSWFYRGTIESRLFNGSIDSNDILSWSFIWASIMEFSLNGKQINKSKPLDNLLSIINNQPILEDFIASRIDQNG